MLRLYRSHLKHCAFTAAGCMTSSLLICNQKIASLRLMCVSIHAHMPVSIWFWAGSDCTVVRFIKVSISITVTSLNLFKSLKQQFTSGRLRSGLILMIILLEINISFKLEAALIHVIVFLNEGLHSSPSNISMVVFFPSGISFKN